MSWWPKARAGSPANKPFHLTSASLPLVARSAAGERQRYAHRVRVDGVRAATLGVAIKVRSIVSVDGPFDRVAPIGPLPPLRHRRLRGGKREGGRSSGAKAGARRLFSSPGAFFDAQEQGGIRGQGPAWATAQRGP